MRKHRLRCRFTGPLSLLRRTDGIVAMEFAIIAPVLLTLVFGIIEFSMVVFVQGAMEASTNITARLGKTGYTANGLTQQETILNKLKATTAGLLNPAQITITATAYNSLSQSGDGTGGANGYGDAGQIVVYTISYPWKLMTPIASDLIGHNGILTITSRTVVRNEPYAD